MTSDSTPGTAVPERAVAVVATVGALVLLAGVALSARGPATADLPTVLVAADAGTVLVTSAGERPAQPGDAVPRGARVRTPAGASAALGTDGRTVRIAPESELVVVDGATQRLERGAALVDAQDGPGVRLLAAGSTVAVREDALVRVDRERLLRVAAYAGPRAGADVTAPGRRRTLEVRRLHQLQVAAGGLPGHAVPLALRAGDPWERDVVPGIVEDDAVLEGTVRALERMPSVARTALPTGLGDDDEAVPGAERALAFALAHADGGFDEATYLDLQDGRALGGSWGVLAALEGVSPSDADRFFDDPAAADTALAAGADGGAFDPSVLAAEVLGTLPGLFPGDDGGSPDGGGSPDDDPGRPGPTSSPRPDATPGPSRDPVREVVDTVVDAVEDVLPTPLPSPLPLPEPPPAPVRPPLAGVEVQAPLVDEIPGAVDTVGDAVDDAVETVTDTVGDTVRDTVDSVGETVRDVGGAVSGPAGGAAGGSVGGGVSGTVGGVVGGLPRR